MFSVLTSQGEQGEHGLRSEDAGPLFSPVVAQWGA
jgi:hypothetical protein